jgi:hypothetical protein
MRSIAVEKLMGRLRFGAKGFAVEAEGGREMRGVGGKRTEFYER